MIREKSLFPEQLLEVVGPLLDKTDHNEFDKGTETLKNCISSNKTDSDCIRSLKTENGRHIQAHNEYDNPMYLKSFFVTLQMSVVDMVSQTLGIRGVWLPDAAYCHILIFGAEAQP